MIYTELLTSLTTIAITSPSKRDHKCGVYQEIPARYASMARVNKQFYDEASHFFYTNNTFLISNGEFGYSHESNLHGINSFVSMSSGLPLIKNLVLQLRFYQNLVCHEDDIPDMKEIATILVDSFVGVTSVRLEIRFPEAIPPRNAMDESDAREELASIVRLVLEHKRLKEIRWLGGQRWVFAKLQSLVEKVMQEKNVDEADCVRVIEDEGEPWKEPQCGFQGPYGLQRLEWARKQLRLEHRRKRRT